VAACAPTEGAPVDAFGGTIPADAPEGKAFYQPPDPLPPGAPGDVLWAAPLDEVPAGSVGWRILYHSVSVHGAATAVSGLVLAPDRDAPRGGFPVVSWAHGTTGAADACAPTRLRNPLPPLAAELLAAGYVVVATDYEGLGTPGPHPYLVGSSEGRSVLDAARAAAELEGLHVSRKVVVWGHSQGGHASLFAGEMAPWYSPELEVVGVVAGAPASDLTALLTADVDVPAYGALVITAAYAWAAVYRDAALSDVLSEAAVDRLDAIEEECLFGVDAVFDRPLAELRTGDLRVAEPWPRLLEENTAGTTAIAAPVLLIQGDLDDLIPADTTTALADRLCRLGGGPVELLRYPDAGHSSVLSESQDDMLAWIAGRFAGQEAPSLCEG